MDTTFIYALNDPETGECRYVGKADDPKIRLANHLSDAHGKNHHCANWLNSLVALGLRPTLEVIDEIPFEHWPQLETAYIEFFREQGCNLVNTAPGGEDPPSHTGKKRSPETRAKMSAAQKGKKRSPEHCAKLSAVRKGKKASLETRAKLSAAHKGNKPSPETRAKLSASQCGNKKFLGKKHSPETRAKISAAQRRRLAALSFPNE